MNATSRFLENWNKLETELRDEPPWLAAARSHGRERFAALGFPTTRQEDWKYTSVKPLTELAFELPDGDALDDNRIADAIARWHVPGASLAIIVDGRWREDLSHLVDLPDCLRIESLRRAIVRDPAWVQEHLGQGVDNETQAFTALNTALWRDGLVIHVEAGLAVEQPIQVLCIATGARRPQEIQLRHLIVLETNAELRLIEHDVGLEGRDADHDEHPTFSNIVTEISLGENASLDRYTIEACGRRSYHVGRLVTRKAHDASVRSHVFTLSGKFLRDDFESVLAETGSECTFNGLFIASEDDLVDHHTSIDHTAPHCTSRELYKGILFDRAQGVFNGKVFVRQDAQGTDSEQNSKNLLLSPRAVINTKPQLEIWADDVKCTHGATIGQLDAEALFYLRARGIGLDEAKSMLIRAFAAELLDGIRFLPLRLQLEGELAEHLALLWERPA